MWPEEYYQKRLDENIFSALAVAGCMLGAFALIVIAVLTKQVH